MRRLRWWRVGVAQLLAVVVLFSSIYWFMSHSIRDAYIEQAAGRLLDEARVLAPIVGDWVVAGEFRRIQQWCQAIGEGGGARITVVLPDGRVVGDSREDPEVLDNHGDRPEVEQALSGRESTSTRFSHTLQEYLLYSAVPLREDTGVAGAVRAALPLAEIRRQLTPIKLRIALTCLAGGILVLALGALPLARVARGVRRIILGAERFAGGDLQTRVISAETPELENLADAMNQMASELEARIQTAVGQRNELQAVLAGMVEGVLAVDVNERIVSMNPAACRLFGVERASAIGRSAQEVIRNADLQRIVARVLRSPEPIEGEIRLFVDQERTLHVRGTGLPGPAGSQAGALLVLHDVTQLQRLENIRRDFVANVSHELRTPITAIRGFVETLLDGALTDSGDARRFLETINRHCQRLSDIIEDLLSLSRIEQGAKDEEIRLDVAKLRPVLEAAVQSCIPMAAAKSIEVSLTCNADITARMNTRLMEQAVVNLLQNAIAYSEPGQNVYVSVSAGDTVRITVKDHGRGIEKQHIPRLFERFYRVDKARGRSEGGTGLGLAIVKHILILHNADIGVDSTPGKGSTFTIVLPRTSATGAEPKIY